MELSPGIFHILLLGFGLYLQVCAFGCLVGWLELTFDYASYPSPPVEGLEVHLIVTGLLGGGGIFFSRLGYVIHGDPFVPPRVSAFLAETTEFSLAVGAISLLLFWALSRGNRTRMIENTGLSVILLLGDVCLIAGILGAAVRFI